MAGAASDSNLHKMQMLALSCGCDRAPFTFTAAAALLLKLYKGHLLQADECLVQMLTMSCGYDRAPFTFTAAAALLAALYVSVRLPNSDRQHQRPQQKPRRLHQSSSAQQVKTAPEATQIAGLAR